MWPPTPMPVPARRKATGTPTGGRWNFKRVSMDSAPFLCVWIRDWGTSFDPFMETATPDTSLAAEERPIGGLGVHLVKNVSAHHCYSGDDGTNTIELYFQLARDEN